MDYVSPWQSPIEVSLGAGHGLAFTYGLVSTELAEATWPEHGFPERLVLRLGVENLQATARAFALDPNDPRERGAAPKTLDLQSNRLRELIEHELVPVAMPILARATAESGRVSSAARSREVSTSVRRFLAVYGPRNPEPRRFTHNGVEKWGRTFAHLIDRAALELFELCATGVRLRRCIYCGSVFVPRRDERCCRWNLWTWPAVLDDPAFRLCSESRRDAVERAIAELPDGKAHERERKRLWAKADRERKAAERAGRDPKESKRVKDAEAELVDYLSRSGVRRGRKPSEAHVDVVPAADDTRSG